MTIHLAYQQLLAQLYDVYDSREAANIADMVIEHVTGQRKIDRIMYKEIPVNEKQQTHLKSITGELVRHRPVQYVLQEAWFMNMKLTVNESVLIPRPETEELVQWIIQDVENSGNKEVSLIDIGTGSGCIPIAIRKRIPEMAVSAVDVSHDALQVAILNSIQQKVLVDFLLVDFLDQNEWDHLGKYNIIVSNPPYIRETEAAGMMDNVLKYEPHLALFVPDDDPLIFYRKIVDFGKAHLKTRGSVYVEINEAFGDVITELFEKNGFVDVILKKDLQQKHRMVKATMRV